MVGFGSKNSEDVPPYEELESQGSRNFLTGYSSVPQNETIDEEQAPLAAAAAPQPHQHQHQPPYLDNTRAPGTCRSNANPLPPPSTFLPHVHCESCDGFIRQQQRMRSKRFCCAAVAVTFMTLFVCGLILGVIIVHAKKGEGKWQH
ncbi:hypothetical protein BJX70DRAFT_381725 [Aspergillus crustosus]